MPRPIIFDCDPGNDDAVALLVTMASPEDFELLGITTVGGNVRVEQTALNALKICELANKAHIPVYAGCPQPMMGTAMISDGAHGVTGMDGSDLPSPSKTVEDEHAVDFITRTLKTHPTPVTLCITGPCTNVALAITRDPSILKNIAEFVIMGGSITAGNITPAAEFNFFCDPYAANVLIESGKKLTLITLDVTHKVEACSTNIARLRAIGNEPANQVAGMMEATMHHDIEFFEQKGRVVHDACVPIYLLRPDLFSTRPAYVHVETTRGDSFANSIISYYPKHVPENTNIQVPYDVDGAEVFNVILERLSRFKHPA